MRRPGYGRLSARTMQNVLSFVKRMWFGCGLYVVLYSLRTQSFPVNAITFHVNRWANLTPMTWYLYHSSTAVIYLGEWGGGHHNFLISLTFWFDLFPVNKHTWKCLLWHRDLEAALEMGVDWSLREGYAWAEDKEHCEEYGRMLQADPSKVSQRAKKRGLPQVNNIHY